MRYIAIAMAASAALLGGCGTRLTSPERGPFVAVLPALPAEAERVQRVARGIDRARTESRATFRVVDGVPPDEEATLKALRAAAASDAKMVVGFGPRMGAPMQRVAWEFPDQRFTLVDGTVEALRPNLAVYDVLSAQSYFLAGVFAGLATKSNVVGLIDARTAEARAPFAAGLKEANPQAKLIETRAITLGDALAAIDAQRDARADIAFVVESPWTPSVAEAARAGGMRLIGAGRDWTAARPDVFVAAAVDETGDAVLAAFRDLRDAVWRGDVVRRFGVRSGAVGLVVAKDVPASIRQAMENYRDQIGAGRFDIPGVVPAQRPLSGK